MALRGLIGALLLLSALPAEAAYRLYKLRISHQDPGSPRPRMEIVYTMLDPYQWPAYHGESAHAKVDVADIWYCPGDTSRHGFCPKPTGKDRTPQMTYPARARIPHVTPVTGQPLPTRPPLK